MLLTKIKAATLAPLLAAIVGIGTVGLTGRTATAQTGPAPDRAKAAPVEAKPKKKVVHNGPISPGIQALATASTDIIIADVMDTNPRKAIEGARDTVKLKVVKTLLGRREPGETVGVYYHLVWTDEKAETLERVKFEKGQRYVVFLNSHGELTDRWLGVLQDRQWLALEIAAAVRVAHGDARGEWSNSVGPFAARLVVYRTDPSNGTPIFTLYLDVRNGAGGNGASEFNLDKASVAWKVTDANGKEIAPTSPPGNGQPTPLKKLMVDAGKSDRLQLSITGGGISMDRAGHLELGPHRVWEFDKGDDKAYYLSGEITIPATGAPGVWYGTQTLTSVKLPVEPE